MSVTGDAVAIALQAAPVLPAFVEALARWTGRFNIAPTSVVPVVVPRPPVPGAASAEREIMFARWGLLPSWAKDVSIGARLTNARGDTIAEKPAFRDAWRSRRCLVPVSAFYEWQQPVDGGAKRPHAFASASGEVLTLGGIWDRWRDPESGAEVRSVAIVTTEANDLMAPVHDRMPVIVHERDRDRWLGAAPPVDLVRPCPAGDLQMWRVATVVNNARNDVPACLVPLRE